MKLVSENSTPLRLDDSDWKEFAMAQPKQIAMIARASSGVVVIRVSVK